MTILELEALTRKGLKVVNKFQKGNLISINREIISKNRIKVPRKEAPQLKEMKQNLRFLGYEFEEEHRVHHSRLFRFDIAFPDFRIGIEYEGLVSEKNFHTSIAGYTSNTEKYNLAAVNGWMVLRYTCKNYKNMIPDLEAIMKSVFT